MCLFRRDERGRHLHLRDCLTRAFYRQSRLYLSWPLAQITLCRTQATHSLPPRRTRIPRYWISTQARSGFSPSINPIHRTSHTHNAISLVPPPHNLVPSPTSPQSAVLTPLGSIKSRWPIVLAHRSRGHPKSHHPLGRLLRHESSPCLIRVRKRDAKTRRPSRRRLSPERGYATSYGKHRFIGLEW
jgi:hypothetical protein